MAAPFDWRQLLDSRNEIQTRRALLIIDMQNDFVSPAGASPLNINNTYIPSLNGLIQTFRKFDGRVIWVRTEFEPEEREAAEKRRSSAAALSHVLSDINPASIGTISTSVEPTVLEPSRSNVEAAAPVIVKKKSMSRLKAKSLLAKISGRKRQFLSNLTVDPPAPSQNPPTPSVETTASSPTAADSLSSDDEASAELSLKEICNITPICIRGTWGAKIADPISKLYDFRSDIDITKRHESAFLDTDLLGTLRTQMVTELFICGCGTNTSIWDTVAAAAQNAFGTTVIEDCMAYRSENSHSKALEYMGDSLGAQIRNSGDVIAGMHETHDQSGQIEKSGTKPKEVMQPKINQHTASLSEKLDDITAAMEVSSLGGSGLDARSDFDSEEDDAQAGELSAGLPYASTRDSPHAGRISQNTMLRGAAMKVLPPSKDVEQKRLGDPNIHASVPKVRVFPEAEDVLACRRLELLDRRAEAARTFHQLNAASQSSEHFTNDSLDVHRAQPQMSGQGPPPFAKTTITDGANNIKGRQCHEPEALGSILRAEKMNAMHVDHMTISDAPTQPEEGASSPAVSRPEGVMHKRRKPKDRKKAKPHPDLSNFPGLGPTDVIGEGDSRVIYNFIPNNEEWGTPIGPMSKKAFEFIQKEVDWQTMHHNDGEVPRLVAVQGAIAKDGSYPIYRHPSDQSPPVKPFTQTVSSCLQQAETLIGHPLNHVLIQLYRSGEDNISEHSDKTLDIVHGSSIVNISFGAQRTMRPRTKRAMAEVVDTPASELDEDPLAKQHARTTQRVPMPHNSMFILGPTTNGTWLHGIQPDKRRAEERSAAELAYGGQRISLTFRLIGTSLSADQRLIWGQGAKGKNREEARSVVNGDEVESRKLIDAFGRENREGAGGWKSWYGEGSDILHFKLSENDSGRAVGLPSERMP